MAEEPVYYNVTKGETLLEAAQANDLTVSALTKVARARNIKLEAQKIVVGYREVPVDDGEPAHNYTRVTYNPDDTINVRTREMLEEAVRLLTAYEWTPYLLQGSYNPGVGASAGTHDGGGVVDIRVSTMSAGGIDLCVVALRKAGFAAWHRTSAQGFSPHIHAVAIGDREMSPSAKDQVEDYFAGRNGLANNGDDNGPRGLWPAWAEKYSPFDEAPEPGPSPSTPGKLAYSQIKYNEKGDHPSGAGACEGFVREALRIAGLPVTTAWINGMLTIASRESAYNHPNWLINTTDSNAKNVPELNNGGPAPDGYPGMCSRGPWQCIPQTFAAYHMAGTPLDIYNPVASVGASITYVQSRYGVARDGSNLAAKVQQADPNRPPKGY